MRIISGEWRGRPLAAPQGSDTRPTSDRAREGLFSMLASRVGSFQGLRVADIFAGTGALGLEALSRGAQHCLFVENDRNAIAVLQANIGRFSAENRAEVRSQSIEHTPPPPIPFDIIVADPPYKTGLAALAADRVCNPLWVAPGGLVSLESDGAMPPVPEGFAVETERRFGKAHILLLRRNPD